MSSVGPSFSLKITPNSRCLLATYSWSLVPPPAAIKDSRVPTSGKPLADGIWSNVLTVLRKRTNFAVETAFARRNMALKVITTKTRVNNAKRSGRIYLLGTLEAYGVYLLEMITKVQKSLHLHP